MKIKTQLKLLPTLVIAALAMMTGKAQARHQNDLSRMADQILDIVEELEEEFEDHYEHSGAYRYLRSDLSRIENKAEHIDDLADDPRSSIRHIENDLDQLDDLSDHLRRVVDDANRGRYSGHIDGGIREVRGLLSSLDNTIHRMERVAASYAGPVHHHDDFDDERDRGGRRHGNAGAAIIGAVIGAAIVNEVHHHGHHPPHPPVPHPHLPGLPHFPHP